MMRKIYRWYTGLSKRVRDSFAAALAFVGALSAFFTVVGFSWGDLEPFYRVCILTVVVALVFSVVYFSIGEVFKEAVDLSIRRTPVTVCCGDIFDKPGWRVIGCDTHFDTRIDDVVISRKSLHGQLVLEHGRVDEINAVVEAEAKRLGLQRKPDGAYDFPLGTIIRYDSGVDGHTYLMLAMTKLDCDYKARTNMAEFEHMLMRMWNEIDRVHASNDVVLPVLGANITRFSDGPKSNEELLRCILCTMNSSGVSFKSKVSIVIYGDSGKIPLYEYRDMLRIMPRR